MSFIVTDDTKQRENSGGATPGQHTFSGSSFYSFSSFPATKSTHSKHRGFGDGDVAQSPHRMGSVENSTTTLPLVKRSFSFSTMAMQQDLTASSWPLKLSTPAASSAENIFQCTGILSSPLQSPIIEEVQPPLSNNDYFYGIQPIQVGSTSSPKNDPSSPIASEQQQQQQQQSETAQSLHPAATSEAVLQKDVQAFFAAEQQQKKFVLQQRNVYMSGFPVSFRPSSFRAMCEVFGRIESSKLCMETDNSNRCKGYGFVLYYNAESAASCIASLNGKVMHGRPLQVRRADLSAAPQPIHPTRPTTANAMQRPVTGLISANAATTAVPQPPVQQLQPPGSNGSTPMHPSRSFLPPLSTLLQDNTNNAISSGSLGNQSSNSSHQHSSQNPNNASVMTPITALVLPSLPYDFVAQHGGASSASMTTMKSASTASSLMHASGPSASSSTNCGTPTPTVVYAAGANPLVATFHTGHPIPPPPLQVFAGIQSPMSSTAPTTAAATPTVSGSGGGSGVTHGSGNGLTALQPTLLQAQSTASGILDSTSQLSYPAPSSSSPITHFLQQQKSFSMSGTGGGGLCTAPLSQLQGSTASSAGISYYLAYDPQPSMSSMAPQRPLTSSTKMPPISPSATGRTLPGSFSTSAGEGSIYQAYYFLPQ